ncbi:MAG: amidohydrolase family protein [Porticoccaceae bacterium]|nr:amidohydrolase family protein [Porticoccaceae bacterium]
MQAAKTTGSKWGETPLVGKYIRLLTAAILASVSLVSQATTVIHAGHLIDVVEGKMLNEQSIIIDNGRITAVESGFVERASATVIDLKDATVMPGFMDMHVHLDGELNPPTSYSANFYMNSADVALQSTVYAKRTLEAGFTTVRDLGSGDIEASFALRNAINRGYVVGPRIYAAGKAIATTGGHGDPTNGIREDLRGDPGPKDGVMNGSEEAYKAVRQRYKDGSDVVKLTVTGGVLSLAKSGDNPQFTENELEAVMAAAKDYNYVVAVHAHGAEGMKRAIRAGVDSVEHGTYMDEEAMKLMKRKGTWYVPTISAGEWVAELATQEGKLPPVVRPKAAAIGPQISATFGRAYRYGVKIAFGTDAGVSPHGANGKEFTFMVAAGMPPMAAIQSATVNAAELLRVSDELGRIAAGYHADIVAVRGDPLADISVLESVDFVMKGGEVFKQR